MVIRSLALQACLFVRASPLFRSFFLQRHRRGSCVEQQGDTHSMGARVIAVVSRIAKKSIEAEPARRHFSEHIACVCVVSVLLPALPQEVQAKETKYAGSLSFSFCPCAAPGRV